MILGSLLVDVSLDEVFLVVELKNDREDGKEGDDDLVMDVLRGERKGDQLEEVSRIENETKEG